MATRLGASQSKISKVENGLLAPAEHEIELWADATGASAAIKDDLIAQRRRVAAQYQDWRALYRGGTHRHQETFLQLESGAKLVRVFQPTLVPGLMQTAEYAQLRLSQWAELHGTGMAAEAVATRMERQAALYNPERSFGFLVLEAALRFRLCPSTGMLAQLDRIASLSTLPNVEVGIIPLSADLPVAPVHPFEMLDEDLVTVETFTGEVSVTAPEEITLYVTIWDMLDAQACHGQAARALLGEIAADFRGRT